MICTPDFEPAMTGLAMLAIMPITLLFHSILYVHGKEHRPDRTESERILRRLLWCLLAIVLILGYGQIGNACQDPWWKVSFLVTAGMIIWEVIYLITLPPEFNRKKHVS